MFVPSLAADRHVYLEFAVNGTSIPDVDYDVGESYAGLLPISDKKDERDHLYFWFFPTVNEEAKKKKEIVIWLNGGVSVSNPLDRVDANAGPISPAARPCWASCRKTAPSSGSPA